MLNQSGKRFAAFLLCLILGCALFASAGGEGIQQGQSVSVNPEEMKATAAELRALAAEVASRGEQLKEMISQRTDAGAAMSDLYDTKLPAVLKDFEEIESGILDAAEAYEQKTNTVEDAADSFSSGEGEQDHSAEINPTELAELAAKLDEYASFLADLQLQLEERGIPLQCSIPEAVGRVQDLKNEVSEVSAAYESADGLPGQQGNADNGATETGNDRESTFPSFTYDELVYPEEYDEVKEWEYIDSRGITVNVTDYYDSDGFRYHSIRSYEGETSFITTYFWYSRLGDSGFVAGKHMIHGDPKPGFRAVTNDVWSYYVFKEDDEYFPSIKVDENGKPIE